MHRMGLTVEVEGMANTSEDDAVGDLGKEMVLEERVVDFVRG